LKPKHNNIPIFIPELACPHRCVFCNQSKISASLSIPEPEGIGEIIEKYIQSTTEPREREIAFFGGNFTGIPIELQKRYLQAAQTYILSGHVSGIRLSTRPDYINPTILKMLKKYHVLAIELGAQSTDDTVLRKSGRGHTARDIQEASKMILDTGFELGLQMMIGLPGDTAEKSMQTARDIVAFGAQTTRIYPTLVIQETQLSNWYHNQKYFPLSLDEAVLLSKNLYRYFEASQVRVIRVGLHPSEELSPEKSLIAGPFHKSFKELVMTDLWKDILSKKLNGIFYKKIDVIVNNTQLNFAVGYESKNKQYFENNGYQLKFKTDPFLSKYDVQIILK